MGALGRFVESGGIATTGISLVREHSERMRPPRALWVPYPLGRPFGVPGDAAFQSAVLRSVPWVTFHVLDYGLQVWNGTSEVFTKLIADTHAAFLPEPSPRWVQYLAGTELVTEGPGGPRHERFGFHAWSYPVHDPSGFVLSALMNGIPALYTPAAIAYGQISGGSYS